MRKLSKQSVQAKNMVLDALDKIMDNPATCVDITDVLPEKVSAIVCELLAEKIHLNACIERYSADRTKDFDKKESESILTAVDKLYDKSSETCMDYLKDFRFEAGLAVLDILRNEQEENKSYVQYVHAYTESTLEGSKKFASKEKINETAQLLQRILVDFEKENITANEAEGLLETKDFFARKATRNKAYADLQALDSQMNLSTLASVERMRNGLNPYYDGNQAARAKQKEEARQRNEIRQRLEATRLRHQNKKRSTLSRLLHSVKKGITD